jgi:myo-inositol-1-phosphate synthase
MSKKIKVAIVGIGNCCSSLYQGLEYYKDFDEDKDGTIPGVMFARIGGYHPADIQVVAAFDVDRRKVGRPLGEAIFAAPNCARVFCPEVPDGPVVQMGPVFDGVSQHMLDAPEKYGFRISNEESVDVAQVLRDTKADILINYCPVGSQEATEYYAECCLKAGVAFMNCIPVFIASDPVWEQKFIDAGLPICGDDMKSAIGASIVSQMLQELAFSRGCVVKFHQQVNVGGNSDFLVMSNQDRLASKKISKENVIRAQNELRGIEIEDESLYAGPSTWIPYLKDHKVAYFRLELESFGGAPVELDCKLKVCDSENSSGVVIDAIRYLKVAKEEGVVGSLRGPSAFTQKTPPEQLPFAVAQAECEAFAVRDLEGMTVRNTFVKNGIKTKSV